MQEPERKLRWKGRASLPMKARAQGYQDVKDWYSPAVAPSLRGPALDVESKTLAANAAPDPGEPEEELERGLPEEAADSI